MTASQQQPVQMVTVDDIHHDQRLDNFLRQRLKGLPKARIYRLIRKGEVRVNKKRAKPDTRLHTNDIVRIPPVTLPQPGEKPRSSALTQQTLAAAIIYQDKDLLVVNKPTGMAVHGGSGVSLGVIEILRQMFPQARFLELVHRLDKETSGCLLVAKKPSILKACHKLLREGAVLKQYQALCLGRWQTTGEKIAAPLLKNVLASGERIVKVTEKGKSSVTLFTTLKVLPDVTLMQAQPRTGRTHQIRVHAAFAGHPIAGDKKYGDKEMNRSLTKVGLTRLFLHAFSLEFIHPGTGQIFKISAPLTADLKQVLHRISLGNLKI